MAADLAVMAMKALDGLSLRADAVAQNIANANTRGYRPLAVQFEDALAAAAAQGDAALADFAPHVERAASLFGSDALRLDLELQNASATAGRYSAIVNVLDRELQMQSLAATGNR
jgi:flagellar basal-body rod protein FlgB